MIKKLVGIFVCTLLIFTILPVSADMRVNRIYNSTNFGNTLYVGGNGPNNYSNIQDAINNASDGDTIFVYNGNYDLIFTIFIDLSIKLIGEDKINTVLNGGGFIINASSVEICNFTFLNSVVIMISPFSEYFTISNNIFKQEEFNAIGGVYIGSNYSTISDNSFFNCGLMVMFSYHNSVYNNTVNGKPLVYFEGVSDRVIDDAGQVILVDCNDITIENLKLSYTLFGIELVDTVNCLISHNDLSKNAIAGLLFNSNNNVISNNIFSDNVVVGLAFVESNDNNISKNSFENNQYSIFFIHSSNNHISYNNFKYIYNRINRNILSTKSDNTWNSNYWNRPRFLPVIIWNFKRTDLKFFPFLPTSPDIDWHPAKEPYNI